MEGSLGLAARIVLAAVLLVSGGLKLAHLEGAREGLRQFGVPLGVLRPAAVLLPVLELVVAVLLVALPSSPWPGWTAAGLLLVFTGAVVTTIASGRRPPCPCFGASSTEVSGRTVVRNGWLVAVAVLATGAAGGADVLPG